MTARPEVVDLLTRASLEMSHPKNWTYIDSGEPLSAEDVELACSATVDDFRAASERSQELAVQSEISASLIQQVADLVQPYFDAHPECRITQDLLPHMTPEDRQKFHELNAAYSAV